MPSLLLWQDSAWKTQFCSAYGWQTADCAGFPRLDLWCVWIYHLRPCFINEPATDADKSTYTVFSIHGVKTNWGQTCQIASPNRPTCLNPSHFFNRPGLIKFSEVSFKGLSLSIFTRYMPDILELWKYPPWRLPRDRWRSWWNNKQNATFLVGSHSWCVYWRY